MQERERICEAKHERQQITKEGKEIFVDHLAKIHGLKIIQDSRI